MVVVAADSVVGVVALAACSAVALGVVVASAVVGV